jgi:hypothetical protein
MDKNLETMESGILEVAPNEFFAQIGEKHDVTFTKHAMDMARKRLQGIPLEQFDHLTGKAVRKYRHKFKEQGYKLFKNRMTYSKINSRVTSRMTCDIYVNNVQFVFARNRYVDFIITVLYK